MGVSGSRLRARARRWWWPVVAVVVSAGCAPEGDEPAVDVEVGSLANGAPIYSYGLLPEDAEALAPDLSIGVLEGDPAYVFGDVRSIDAASDGTIYVLDTQASEIRTYDAAGAYVATIATRGEGPGEISESNGIVLKGDSLLWVQDYRKWRMLALRKDGTEVLRIEMPALNHAYMWNGAVDDAGRIWKAQSHSDVPSSAQLDEGLSTGSYRSFQLFVHPATDTRDSIFLGEVASRTYVTRGSNWNSYSRIPFDPMPQAVVDPAGGVWLSDPSAYTVVRLDLQGDTVLRIDAAVEPPPVTDAERDEYFDEVASDERRGVRTAEALVDAMPVTRPAISALAVDDRGNLWVRRGGTEADRPRYDVFRRDGAWLGAVRLDFTPSPYFPIRVRGGHLYVASQDELGVPSVVRVRLPDYLGEGSSTGP